MTDQQKDEDQFIGQTSKVSGFKIYLYETEPYKSRPSRPDDLWTENEVNTSTRVAFVELYLIGRNFVGRK